MKTSILILAALALTPIAGYTHDDAHKGMMQGMMPGMMHGKTEGGHSGDGGHAQGVGKPGELVWQFTKAGTVDFACLQPGHFEAGMMGKVSVK